MPPASTFTQLEEPTIYALSTASGRAAIAIIRISGAACLGVYRALCPGKPLPKPRYATLRTLINPSVDTNNAEVLDSGALTFYFPAPETATGEDVLELHIHGGPAVVKAVLAAIPNSIPKHAGQTIRYAEPGEFTRRAFYNNRLDLLQIESLGDTLAADTEQQRRLAVRGSTSASAERYELWRQKLLDARGELEALIDFSEDQHFEESPVKLCASVAEQVRDLKSQLRASIESAARGELLRNGISVALIGAPNAGKSSLLNRIVGREAAIVSNEAGTTRDVVDVSVDIGGYLCRFGDLAGLRNEYASSNEERMGAVEREGMRRAEQRALTADVVVVTLSLRCEGSETKLHVGSAVDEMLKKCDQKKQQIVFVLNKIDLLSSDQQVRKAQLAQLTERIPSCSSKTMLFPVSCIEAEMAASSNADFGGIQALLRGLMQVFATMTTAVVPEGSHPTSNASAWVESLGATERQRLLLQQCLEHLDSFLVETKPAQASKASSGEVDEEVDIVLAAESLRSAAECLARITGRGEAGDVEEVLGVVFEKFCVGK
ncbi:mitochondrial splicing system protein [Puttea exsequens]|nr:mitochondrial splicing system protein [Puttea exsequens]